MRWFDPRGRSVSTYAFILNRITALGLTLYLAMHLVALSQLAIGESAYDSFIALASGPVFKFFEMFVIAGGVLHGLNGIRIALTSFGVGVRHQRVFFYSVLTLAIVFIAYFGFRMFGGE